VAAVCDPRASELIVYACPIGPLAEQIAAYYAEAGRRFGPNAAHRYPAHCTLTGFFHDDLAAVAVYSSALGMALEWVRPKRPERVVAVVGAAFGEAFHGLVLESPWLQALTAEFKTLATSPTRRDDLRLKDWLHLSLAYEFAPEHGSALASLARAMVDPQADASWDLRLYERLGDGTWACHASWPL
jgi:ubiquitin-associated SH3 domain-containing protein